MIFNFLRFIVLNSLLLNWLFLYISLNFPLIYCLFQNDKQKSSLLPQTIIADEKKIEISHQMLFSFKSCVLFIQLFFIYCFDTYALLTSDIFKDAQSSCTGIRICIRGQSRLHNVMKINFQIPNGTQFLFHVSILHQKFATNTEL